MRRILLVLIALALAVGAISLLVMRDAGTAHLGWGSWQVETTMAGLLGVVIVSVLILGVILWLVNWLVRVPVMLRMRRQRKLEAREWDDLEHVLRQWVAGDWDASERLCQRHKDSARGRWLWIMASAFAAHKQGLSARCEDYLKQAEQDFPNNASSVRLLQAQWQMQAGRADLALPIVQRLAAQDPRHPALLRLLAEAERREGDWDGVLQRLPVLTKLRALPDDELLALEEAAVEGRLAQLAAQGAPAIEAFWRDIRKSLRGRERLLAAKAIALASCGEHDQAVDLLFAALRERPSAALSAALVRMNPTQTRNALDAAEALMSKHTAAPNADLTLFAAHMAWRQDMWGKARAHAEAVLQLPANEHAYAEAHILLSQLDEREGQPDKALAQVRAAFDALDKLPEIAAPAKS
ncbi:MAG: heme biosynthesis HemY N-terminal domain-containing protein [Pseudomonadota bacterium]